MIHFGPYETTDFMLCKPCQNLFVPSSLLAHLNTKKRVKSGLHKVFHSGGYEGQPSIISSVSGIDASLG